MFQGIAPLRKADEAHYGLLDYESESNENLDKFPSIRKKGSLCWQAKSIWLPNLILFFISITCLAISATQYIITHQSNHFLKQLYPYSTILEEFPIEFHTQIVNGSLFDRERSPYRADPSPETDKIWEEVTSTSLFTINSEQVLKLGKDPSKTVKAPLSWGQGPDAHVVELDSQHALHCLNAVRKFAYFDHYYRPTFGSFNNMSAIQHHHLSHCLNIVLQNMLCQPSMGIITHNWVDTQRWPYPDFSIERQCVNHQAMIGWQNDRAAYVGGEWRDDIFPVPGDFVMPVFPEMQAWQDSLSPEEKGKHSEWEEKGHDH